MYAWLTIVVNPERQVCTICWIILYENVEEIIKLLCCFICNHCCVNIKIIFTFSHWAPIAELFLLRRRETDAIVFVIYPMSWAKLCYKYYFNIRKRVMVEIRWDSNSLKRRLFIHRECWFARFKRGNEQENILIKYTIFWFSSYNYPNKLFKKNN